MAETQTLFNVANRVWWEGGPWDETNLGLVVRSYIIARNADFV